METITKQELETLKQIVAQANPNGWTDWAGHGKSKRTHIGYLSNHLDGTTANIALFETNTNAKRADVLLAIYARNYLPALIVEIEHLRAEVARLTAECKAASMEMDKARAELDIRRENLELCQQRLITAENERNTYHAENARMTAEAAWIPVTERLPEKETSDLGEEYIVLLCYPYEMAIAASFVGGDWYTGHVGCSTRWTDKVTHWRPLPLHPDAARQAVTRVTNEPAKLTLDPAARIT